MVLSQNIFGNYGMILHKNCKKKKKKKKKSYLPNIFLFNMLP